MTARGLAPLTGVLAVVLIVVGFTIADDSPDFDAAGEEVIAFYDDNESSQTVGTILFSLGALFVVFFAGSLRTALRRADDEVEGLATLALVGASAMAVGMGIFAGITFTLLDATNDPIEPAAAQAMNMLNGDLFVPLAIGFVVFLISSGIGIVRSGAFPKWLGWVAILIGVLGVTPVGFFAFGLSGLWILILSILMFRRAAEAEAAPA